MINESPLVKPGNVVRHRKGGVYVVIGLGRLEANWEECVIYRASDGTLIARSLVEFTDGRFTIESSDAHHELSWRCFHCDEVFTDADKARDHFGDGEGCDPEMPACKLNELEGGILKLYREALAEIRSYQDETDLTSKYFYEMGCTHHQALIREEEKGYARGLRDGQNISAQGVSAITIGHDQFTCIVFFKKKEDRDAFMNGFIEEPEGEMWPRPQDDVRQLPLNLICD